MEALFVLMVVSGYFAVIFLAAVVLVLLGTFIAAMLNTRSMGYRGWQGKLRYAVVKTFG